MRALVLARALRGIPPILALLLAVATGPSRALAQSEPLEAHVEAYVIESGARDNPGDQPVVVFDHTIRLGPDVPWIRVSFLEAVLEAGSRIRITSLADGEVQNLDAETVIEWGYSSAFFNGSAVRIELVAGPYTIGNRFKVKELLVGDPPGSFVRAPSAEPEAICDGVDDRTQSDDARVGRLLPGAPREGQDPVAHCTGFIIDTPPGSDKCMLTAGHCFIDLQPKGAPPVNEHPVRNPYVLQFNVPKSKANCRIVHPPVRDQYPVVNFVAQYQNDPTGNPRANDWAVFHCARNSESRKTPYEAQGRAFRTASDVSRASYSVEVTGFGRDGGAPNPCDPCVPANPDATRRSVQQTSKGAATVNETAQSKLYLDHTVDTCPASSGSPIIDQSTGQVIGIHTKGGCKDASKGFRNAGTIITEGDLADAIAKCKGKVETKPGHYYQKLVIDASQEVPSNPSTATGSGTIIIDTAKNILTFRITHSGLSSAETAAHIHGPAPRGANAGVLFPLPAGSPKVGVWNYPESLEADILAGRTYVNIHSANFPGGEIRGQIEPIKSEIVHHRLPIDASQEVPSNASTATGIATVLVDKVRNVLVFDIEFSGLSGVETAAHIHGPAARGANAGVLFGLPAGSPKIGAWDYPETREAEILAGLTYINIHSMSFPGGEIRGQIEPDQVVGKVPSLTEWGMIGLALVLLATAAALLARRRRGIA